MLTRKDLLGLGFSAKEIKHRLARGRLHPVIRGVYAVGRPDLTQEGRWMAAVLACGDGAVLSHASAASLWGVARTWKGRPRPRPTPVHVSLPRRSSLRRPGIRAHARPGLRPEDLTSHRGIPVTSPVRTLLDLATHEPANRIERAVNEADKHDLIDPETLRRAIEAYAGEPGVRPLRGVLDRDTFLLSDDELELLFHPLAGAAGLPLPEAKVMVNGFEVDFFWPALGLLVETDGWRYHRTPAAQTRDALRFQLHTAAGLTPLRFSHHQVKHEPGHVVAILRATASGLAA